MGLFSKEIELKEQLIPGDVDDSDSQSSEVLNYTPTRNKQKSSLRQSKYDDITAKRISADNSGKRKSQIESPTAWIRPLFTLSKRERLNVAYIICIVLPIGVLFAANPHLSYETGSAGLISSLPDMPKNFFSKRAPLGEVIFLEAYSPAAGPSSDPSSGPRPQENQLYNYAKNYVNPIIMRFVKSHQAENSKFIRYDEDIDVKFYLALREQQNYLGLGDEGRSGPYFLTSLPTYNSAIAGSLIERFADFDDLLALSEYRKKLTPDIDDLTEDVVQAVKNTIQRSSLLFDFVMMEDYLDMSLIILKYSFGWSWDDILYVKNDSSIKKSSQIKPASSSPWGEVDFLFYDYANRTFWDRVENFGHEKMNAYLEVFAEKLDEFPNER